MRQALLTARPLGTWLVVNDLAPEVAPGGRLLGSAGSIAGPLPSSGLHLRLPARQQSGLELLLAPTPHRGATAETSAPRRPT